MPPAVPVEPQEAGQPEHARTPGFALMRETPLADLRETLRSLRDGGYVRFVDLTAVDNPEREERFELNYIVYHMDRHEWARVKARTAIQAPSVADIFPGANAYEREVYDMFGVTFDGHPMLRRILMPDDWVGYPLRKDEPLGGEEVDFTTRRGPHGD